MRKMEMRRINTEVIPFQVQNLINNLLSKKESVEIRSNYRNTLDDIQLAINDALKKFDKEKVENWNNSKISRRGKR